MAQGVKGTRGVVRNITIPPDIWARIEKAAAAHYSGATGYVARFLIANIDIIAPPEDPE